MKLIIALVVYFAVVVWLGKQFGVNYKRRDEQKDPKEQNQQI